MKVLVTQSCPTLCDPLNCNSVHGILQARILERVAILFSRVSPQPRDWTPVSCIAGDSLLSEPPGKLDSSSNPHWEIKNTGKHTMQINTKDSINVFLVCNSSPNWFSNKLHERVVNYKTELMSLYYKKDTNNICVKLSQKREEGMRLQWSKALYAIEIKLVLLQIRLF